MGDVTKRSLNEKEFKNLRIHNILREKGDVSRADLTAITKINAVSISNYINSFMKRGLIVEKEVGASSGGRPPIILELNNKKALIIGIYITKHVVSGILSDLSIKELNSAQNDVNKDVKKAVFTVINTLKQGMEQEKLKGIGISQQDTDNDIGDLMDAIEAEFNAPVFYAPNAVAASYAEYMQENNLPEGNVLYSYSDLGDCVFAENFEFYTWEKLKFENCMYLKPWGSSMGIVNHAKKLIEQGIGTGILTEAGDSIDNIKDADVFRAAKKKDVIAGEILEFAGLNLGVRLAYLINVFKPHKLVLGGGVEQSGDYFLEQVKRSVEKLALDELSAKIGITYSALSNKDAVCIGLAALVVREIFIGV